MGMYTGLRVNVKIKKEYLDVIEEFIDSDWDELEDFYDKNLNLFSRFKHLERKYMIPYGSLSYMPEQWDDYSNERTKQFVQGFNKNLGTWSFQCSLKNYDREIEVFIDDVLNEVVEEVYCIEKLYEEESYSTEYFFDKDNDEIVYKRGFLYAP